MYNYKPSAYAPHPTLPFPASTTSPATTLQLTFSDAEHHYQTCPTHGDHGQSSQLSFLHHDISSDPKAHTSSHATAISSHCILCNPHIFITSTPNNRNHHHHHPYDRSMSTTPTTPTTKCACPHPDCQDSSGLSAKLFSRKADLARHIRSTHEEASLDCPFDKCTGKGTMGFTRKDHLVEHRRQYHAEDIP